MRRARRDDRRMRSNILARFLVAEIWRIVHASVEAVRIIEGLPREVTDEVER